MDNDDQNQQILRTQIIKIQNDSSLTPTEKARKTQMLMLERFNKAKSTEILCNSNYINDNDSSVLKVENEEIKINKLDYEKTWNNEEQNILGCKHYHRANKLLTECCKKWYTCRLCHDEQEDHKIDRHATKYMLCMRCNMVQTASQICISCKEPVAKYFCDICKLWSDDPNKSIYHCDGCGICRVGKGHNIDYFHCDKCCACYTLSMKNNHKCIEQVLKRNCPICFDCMFETTKKVVLMKCGHYIHKKCYKEHVKSSYQCPICLKSLGDMSEYWSQLDRQLEYSLMPPDYQNHRSNIFCNDCQNKSETKYHWLGHKCQTCGSYNTTLLKTFATENVQVDDQVNNSSLTDSSNISTEIEENSVELVENDTPILSPDTSFLSSSSESWTVDYIERI